MSKVKITFNGPEKPAERKIVGWRSKRFPGYVYLLEGGGYRTFNCETGSLYDCLNGGCFDNDSYDPIYEGEFSVTITA